MSLLAGFDNKVLSRQKVSLPSKQIENCLFSLRCGERREGFLFGSGHVARKTFR